MDDGATTGHSRMGVASFALSAVTGLLFAGLVLVAWLASKTVPPGGDVAAGYGVLFWLLGLMAVLFEIAALTLGLAGTLQRTRRRPYALLGVACSVFFLVVIGAQIGLVGTIAGPSDEVPKVHVVSEDR